MGVLFATRRTVVRGKPEQLINGDLETYAGVQDDAVDDTFPGWTVTLTGGGDIVDATATAHTGSSAVKLTNGNDGCRLTQQITVVTGEVHLLDFWTRGDGAVGGRYSVWDADNAANIIAVTATGIIGAIYTRHPITVFTVPVGCTTVDVILLSPNAPGDAYFDDVSVRLV